MTCNSCRLLLPYRGICKINQLLKIRLLGQFDLTVDGAAVEISSRPAQTLLANLALNAGKSQRREMLARHYLRQALWRIRKAIGESYLLADRMTISFDPAEKFWLDVAALEKLDITNIFNKSQLQ
jgi:DNA-binding SARP family transcriptional activator